MTMMINFIKTTFSYKYGFQKGFHKIKNTKYTLNYKIKRTRYQLKSLNQRFNGALLKIFTFADCLARGVKILNGMVIA